MICNFMNAAGTSSPSWFSQSITVELAVLGKGRYVMADSLMTIIQFGVQRSFHV